MAATGSSFAVALIIQMRWPISSSLRHQRRLCPPWCRPLAHGGVSKRTWKQPKLWDSMNTRVRSYLGWYRHLTLVLLAYAFLVTICVQEREASEASGEDLPARSSFSLIAFTPCEVRHWLA